MIYDRPEMSESTFRGRRTLMTPGYNCLRSYVIWRSKILEYPPPAPDNPISLPSAKILGAPNASNQYGVAVSQTISAVRPRFISPGRNYYGESRERVSNV